MHQLKFSRQFIKDVRRWKKSGQNMAPFDAFVAEIVEIWPPSPQYEPHLLLGTFDGVWDIHLRQNWVLLLRFHAGTIHFLRMGTHADLGL